MRLVEQLFGQHAGALRRFLRGRSVPRADIEDLVQELFARLMDVERLEERMSDSTGSNRSYLLTMANNMVVGRLRKLQTHSAYLAVQRGREHGQSDQRTPERIVAAQLELEAMMAVIMGMPRNWRLAFVLLRFGNMSYEEIACQMGVTVKRVGKYLEKAMRRIRKARQQINKAGEKLC